MVGLFPGRPFMYSVLIVNNSTLIKFRVFFKSILGGQPVTEHSLYEFMHCISHHDVPLESQLVYSEIPY